MRGESIFILGPAGIGKTSDLQFLLDDKNAQQNYFGTSEILTYWINGDELYDSGLQKNIDQLENLPRSTTQHIIIIVDHADRLSSKEHYTPLFSVIRAIRESTRPRTSVICLSSVDLTRNSNLGSLTPIEPLILENKIAVPALSDNDANTSLSQWEKYYETTVDKQTKKLIISATNGIPRLIKRFVKLASDGTNLPTIIDNPALDPKLKLDLERIAEFNRANPESAYSIPMLDHLEQLTSGDYEQIGPIRFPNHLSRQEYDLAEFLIDRKGQFVSREAMIEAVWKNKMYDVNDHALDQMLHRLRKRLTSASPKCDLITYRGRGCKLETQN